MSSTWWMTRLTVLLLPLLLAANSCLLSSSHHEVTAFVIPERNERFIRSSSSNRKSSLALSSLATPQQQWEVFVDQSKGSLEKGGSATLDAFIGLVPGPYDATGTTAATTSTTLSNVVRVTVKPAILTGSAATLAQKKGPMVRCISNLGLSLDVTNVDSVDKVYRILTKHMQIKGISTKVVDCLKWKYKANGFLEAGKVTSAIDAYDRALSFGVAAQEGNLLLMRSTAFLQRAALHRAQLQEIVKDLIGMVPDTATLQQLYVQASQHQNVLANSIFSRILEDSQQQEQQFRRIQYRHGLYQYALLQAAQDALRATELLPAYATSWLRAGEILSELWKVQESVEYYERAMELDAALQESLAATVLTRLEKRRQLLDTARAYGWSEDTLRLALDVAG